MKTKNLVIIFILFLLITLVSGLVVFLTREKAEPILDEASKIIDFSNQPAAEKKPAEVIKNKSVLKTAVEAKPVEEKPAVQPVKTILPKVNISQAEQIQAVMIISGLEYRTAIKPDSSVYDFMNTLRAESKVNFKGNNYSGMGFFIEEINGVKNNPAGENWVYYLNGRPAPVGISYYNLKNNDIIEWKYEKKFF